MAINSSTPLPQEITDLITAKAKRLVRHHRFTESDREDIEQTIKLAIVRKRSAVGEARAQHMGFLITLVQHAVADIIAARQAGCRDYRCEDGSLDQCALDASGEWAQSCDSLSEDDAGKRIGQPGMSPDDLRDLRIDFAEAASSLSPRLREILDSYTILGSPRDVAKAIGLHHSTVYDALDQIKQHFMFAGLDAYLPAPRKSTRQF